ncbi:MAG TPA: DUF4013 domain-containing protein [Vicinamibacteria bacterium]|nr:DUF4013 domain-containing protein [Vicinamibacteria bacterium]
MPAARDGLDLGKTLRFFFEDPDWVKKGLIGGLFCLLGVFLVGAFFVAGYMLRTIQRVVRGEERPLPDWDDLGGIFGDGVRAIGVYLIYVLPIVLVPLFVVVASAVVFGGAASLAERSREVADAMGAMFGLVVFGLYGLFAIAMLAVSFYLPSALVRLALLGRFGAALEWRENVGFIRRNLGPYVLALAFYLVANFVSQFGVLLCCVGVFPVTFWSVAVLAYGLGQVARGDAELRVAASAG